MRKLQIIYDRHPDDLKKRVNDYFEKLDSLGFQVIKTDYAIGSFDAWTAFIEYEKKPGKEK